MVTALVVAAAMSRLYPLLIFRGFFSSAAEAVQIHVFIFPYSPHLLDYKLV